LKETVRKLLTVLGARPPQAICHARSAGKMNSAIERAGLRRISFRRFGFGPFTLFSRPLFSNRRGWAIHSKLQELADRNWPILRSSGHVYIVVARKLSGVNKRDLS